MTGSDQHQPEDDVPTTPSGNEGWATYQPPDPSSRSGETDSGPEWGQGWGQPAPADPASSSPSGSTPASPNPYGPPQSGTPAYGTTPATGGQPAYPAYPNPAGYAGYPPPNQAQATTAMVLGIVSLAGAPLVCGLTLILGPVALVMGYNSGKEIDASNGSLGGKGAASAGFVMGIIATAFLVLALLLLLMVFGLAGA